MEDPGSGLGSVTARMCDFEHVISSLWVCIASKKGTGWNRSFKVLNLNKNNVSSLYDHRMLSVSCQMFIR